MQSEQRAAMGEIDRYLISYCAPTLANLKTGSLFNYDGSSEDDLTLHLLAVNRQLNCKGVFIEALRTRNSRALILVYRKSKLEEDLQRSGVPEFLSRYGYIGNSLADHIEHLKYRFTSAKDFPHEVGIFLGYPLRDVIGFIENAGLNSKCTGCWKVYSDECEATKLFIKYRKCSGIYRRLLSCGRSVVQLTVAV